MWRGLPDRVFIARSFIAPGEYEVRLPTQADGLKKIKVDGRYMVIPVRLFKDKTYFGEPIQLGQSGALPPSQGGKPAAREKRPAKPDAPVKTKPAA
jgi:hypothetical protein